MESDFCLNMRCGHHRKDHRGATGQCTKCACRQGRYTEADKGGQHAPAKGAGHKQ
jgi:hypothetical protein